MLPRLSDIDPEFSLGAFAHAPTPMFLLLLALAIDAAFGSLLRRAIPFRHPDRLIEALVRALETRLNREQRSAATRLIRGLLLVLFVLTVAAATAAVISLVAGFVPFGWAVVLVVLLAFVSQHRPFVAARDVARTLETLPAAGSEDAGQDLPLLSAHGGEGGSGVTTRDNYAAARGAAERLAGGYGFGLVGAAFWFALLGLPGLILYRTIAVMGHALDETRPRNHLFGLTPTRLFEAVAWIPVRLAAVLLALAALFVQGGRPGVALATMVRGTRGHAARGAAWPIAALAGGLGLSLAGPRPLDAASGGLVPWIGPTGGRAKVTALDIRRALFLYAIIPLTYV